MKAIISRIHSFDFASCISAALPKVMIMYFIVVAPLGSGAPDLGAPLDTGRSRSGALDIG
jgi:hypothetical protein